MLYYRIYGFPQTCPLFSDYKHALVHHKAHCQSTNKTMAKIENNQVMLHNRREGTGFITFKCEESWSWVVENKIGFFFMLSFVFFFFVVHFYRVRRPFHYYQSELHTCETIIPALIVIRCYEHKRE